MMNIRQDARLVGLRDVVDPLPCCTALLSAFTADIASPGFSGVTNICSGTACSSAELNVPTYST